MAPEGNLSLTFEAQELLLGFHSRFLSPFLFLTQGTSGDEAWSQRGSRAMVGLKTSVVLKPDEPSSEALGDQAGSFGVRVIVPFLASSLLPPPCSLLPGSLRQALTLLQG